jgi:adenine-specific DNA-methyltransferase
LVATKPEPFSQPTLPLLDQTAEMSLRRPLYQVINWLNGLTGRKDGFVYRHYCAGSGSQRNYFSDENGQRCDAIRYQLEEWRAASLLSGDEYYLLLAALLEAVDRVANTASVYAAFLKHIKTTALKPLRLIPPPIIESNLAHEIYCSDANELTRRIECDVLYLDPPYNHRQYATNYHILETIAVGDSPELSGKTGLRPYTKQRSRYCLKSEATAAFTELVKQVRARHIILSYNDEGLLSADDLQAIFRQRGTCEVRRLPYKRFRADKDRENRCYAPNKAVNELLFYVRIEDQAVWAA